MGGFTGVPLGADRGETTKKALTIEWVYPVHAPKTKIEGDGTRAKDVREALPVDEAYRLMAAEDDRPLLVLREFGTFDDPSNEKLSRKLYTEKVVLLTHWFRCVRLPHHVEQADHPFHNLFAKKSPPQLFLASRDGDSVVPFDFTTKKADLVDTMERVLKEHYEKNPTRVLGKLVKMLPQFDKVDTQILELKEAFDKAIEDKGPRSSEARKIESKLKKAIAKREDLKKQEKALRDIPLKVVDNSSGKGSSKAG